MLKPFLHSDILLHILEGSCSTSFSNKIDKDFLPSILSSTQQKAQSEGSNQSLLGFKALLPLSTQQNARLRWFP